MLRMLLETRALVATIVAAAIGSWGLWSYPMNADDVFLGFIQLQNPEAFRVLAYGYATLWFSTPFFLASLVTSVTAIVVLRQAPSARSRPLPPYAAPEAREAPSVVLGETHRLTTPGRGDSPTWLTVPQRGLYTGTRERRPRACIRTSSSCYAGGRMTPSGSSVAW
jgi:hypothetical protein